MDKKPKKPRRSQKNIPFSFINTNYNPISGEISLWNAVITQAVMDALSNSTNKEIQFQKNEAIRWLTENNKDFIEVCLNANLNPEETRRKAKKALANPTKWRAAAGTGSRYEERKNYRLKIKARKDGGLKPPSSEYTTDAQEFKSVIIGPWSK